MSDAEAELERFIGKYSDDVAAVARAAIAKLRAKLPGALELVWDNYNALAIAYGPTERASDVVFSIALYPRWVSLFFAKGAKLDDPEGLLKGSGNAMRHIVLTGADVLDRPALRRLMKAALALASPQLDKKQQRRTVIKSIAPKQRPRRPAKKGPRRAVR
jgi:hypothetical protein